MGIVKYNKEVFSLCVKYAFEGYADWEIARMIGVHKQSLCNWRRANKNLKQSMDDARTEGAKSSIERGLRILAEGAETKEETQKYLEKKTLVDDEGNEYEIPVEITRKHKKLAPSAQAIEILARKYEDKFSKNPTQDTNIHILEGFNMRDLQDSLKENPIDQYGSKAIEAEYEEIRDDESED